MRKYKALRVMGLNPRCKNCVGLKTPLPRRVGAYVSLGVLTYDDHTEFRQAASSCSM